MTIKSQLTLLKETFDIHRLTQAVDSSLLKGQWFMAKTADECSLVCEQQNRQWLAGLIDKSELDWRMIKVMGPLDFALTGIIAELSGALAKAEIPVFVVSTFDTDYLLIKSELATRAVSVLTQQGFEVAEA